MGTGTMVGLRGCEKPGKEPVEKGEGCEEAGHTACMHSTRARRRHLILKMLYHGLGRQTWGVIDELSYPGRLSMARSARTLPTGATCSISAVPLSNR